MKKFSLSGEHKKAVKYTLVLILTLLSLGLMVTSVNDFVQYSSLTVGLVKACVGIVVWLLIDDVVFHDFETVKEIKEKNIAYALLYFGAALIVAACIGFA